MDQSPRKTMKTETGQVVIAGGSGFLGISLAHHLVAAGRPVILLSRTPPRVAGPWKHLTWDGRSDGNWRDVLEGADGLINLAGRSVNCIKTPDHCDEILRSRVESTLALGIALRKVQSPPPVWIQMSTAHIYGDPPQSICTEDSELGYGLAPHVAKAWEESYRRSLLPGQRDVILRTSFVIGRDLGAGGGALSTLKLITRIGLGGRVGSGTQGMSWIHEHDLNCLFQRGLEDNNMRGAYVASAPNPVSQQVFMKTLREALRIPFGLPAMEWMVRIGAPLIFRTDPELVLYGRYVKSHRLEEEGFSFRFPELRPALQHLA